MPKLRTKLKILVRNFCLPRIIDEILAIVHIVNKAARQRTPLPRPVSARLRRVLLGGDFDRVDAEYDAVDANCQVVTSSDWSAIAIFIFLVSLTP